MLLALLASDTGWTPPREYIIFETVVLIVGMFWGPRVTLSPKTVLIMVVIVYLMGAASRYWSYTQTGVW